MESVLSEHEARDRTTKDGRGLWLRWEKTKAFLASITSGVTFYHKQKPFMWY